MAAKVTSARKMAKMKGKKAKKNMGKLLYKKMKKGKKY